MESSTVRRNEGRCGEIVWCCTPLLRVYNSTPVQNPLVLEGCSFSPERQHSKPAKSLSMSINGQAGRQVRPSAYRLHICIPLGSRAAAAAAAAAGGF